jgi:hypothetical protein
MMLIIATTNIENGDKMKPLGQNGPSTTTSWLGSPAGYGVKPSYVLGWFIFLIGSFGFISWVGNGLKPESNQYSSEKVSLGDALYYSLMVFIGASTDIKPIGRYRYLLPVERIFGWLLLALFITTLGHVMIR